MFCGQCGKRVLDTMLFCPFCGSPIVIPDQEIDGAPAEPVAPQPVEMPEPEAVEIPEEEDLFAVEPEAQEDFVPLPVDETEAIDALAAEAEAVIQAADPEPEAPEPHFTSLFDDLPPEEEFAPLEFDAQEESEAPAEAPNEDAAPSEEEAPKPTSPAQRRASDGASRRSNQTYIPVKNVDLDDMFMDNTYPDFEDEYDPYDDEGDDFREDFDYEEPERGSFWQRHIRGIVGFILLMMVVVIFLIWAIMPRGQQVLATVNLAWSAESYNDLGYDAYNAGQYRQAAAYFERALARDSKNYEYAHSAMVAYYEAGEVDSALAMLKKCIEMQPTNAEPYTELLILYPDASDRPWEVQELLRQGYERTGDESLNMAGE